jgi:UDPglucose 6-dehydrogenase
MQVVVVGGGRVGLPTALSFARIGHLVRVLDTDPGKVAALSSGVFPFYEPGLEAMVFEQVSIGRLCFTTDPKTAYDKANIAVICVDTPMQTLGEADLGAVFSAAQTIAGTGAELVVATKSTVPVGTGARIQSMFDKAGASRQILVVSNPEFLQEGAALEEALRPTRIVVGSDSPEALSVLRDAYSPLVQAGATWVETDLATAELIKYASNAFLAMKISYANALADICDAVGADVVPLVEALGLDARIGPGHLRAGIGYGGGCLGKDLAALQMTLKEHGLDVPILREIEAINDRALSNVLKKIQDLLGDLAGRRVVLLGLAFKPNTDDVRAAPSLRLAADLLDAGAVVVGYDPRANEAASRALPALAVFDDPYLALEDADCAVVCTEWDKIRSLDLERVSAAMARPIIVDGRNIFDPNAAAAAGLTYAAMGRPSRLPAASRTVPTLIPSAGHEGLISRGTPS